MPDTAQQDDQEMDPMPEMPVFVAFMYDDDHEYSYFPGFLPNERLVGHSVCEISSDKVASILVSTPHNSVYPDYAIRILDVHEGDLIPISRAVYRVDSITPGRLGRESSAKVLCRRLDTLPEGVQVTEGAYPFPFCPITENIIHSGFFLRLHNIVLCGEFVPAKDDMKPAVNVIVSEPSRTSNGSGKPKFKSVRSTVRVGDLLKIGTHSHKVVNIIPLDKEKQVIGWFEINIEPEPVPQVP